MRRLGFFASFLLASTIYAQQAIQLPAPTAAVAQPADTFRFVSDGPRGPGWSRPDEIARKYFHENLPALFARTLALDADFPPRATLRWIFTGPRAGFTVELTSSKVRIAERYYDSMALYEGQGNFPEKTTFTDERQYTGGARTVTVIADAHLAVRILLNGRQILEAPLLFDVTRHQLMLAASRTAHQVVTGALLQPDAKMATITLNPSDVHQTMLGFGGSPSIPAYAELSDEGKSEYWQILKRYNLLLSREYPMGTELKPDLSNLEDLRDATPHYYGDNFPNSEYRTSITAGTCSGSWRRRDLRALGTAIMGHSALQRPQRRRHRKQAHKACRESRRIRAHRGTYCRKAQAATGTAPLIVGMENEVDQPPRSSAPWR